MSTHGHASLLDDACQQPADASSEINEHDLLQRLIATQSEIVQAGLDPYKVVDVVTRRAQELTRSTGAVVEILVGSELVYWSASGSAQAHVGLRTSLKKSLAGLCVSSRRALRCDDSEVDPRVDREVARQTRSRSALVVPLPYADSIIGVLEVMSPTTIAYGPKDIRTLELLSSLIGNMLGHAVQHASIEAAINSRAEHERLLDQDATTARDRIRGVIEAEDFEMAFQPIVELESNRTVGVEALARFRSALDQSPDRWFHEAAQVGVGLELELATLRSSLAALDRIPEHMYLAVNVSPETLVSPQLVRLCAQCDARRVVLEITEHSLVEDYGALSERAASLRRIGIRLAIDDAGAGFASLRHVLKLCPDLIKIDRSITRDIDTQLRHQSLASAMLTFAQGTSAFVVAEGIETANELSTLKQLGIPYGQGYYLGHPVLGTT
jgi:EAL domain-containing protein (putative c-di-GMP-specific phosphodiesterase class I)